MAELPIMPVKTDALLADTHNMSAEEFGAYCRLLFTMWRQGGRLNEDVIELARISGLTLRRWRKISNRVMRLMTVVDGVVTQKRLSSTWLDVQEVRKKRAVASNKRWSKRNANGMHLDSTSTPLGVQVESIGNANQNQTKKDTLSSVTESERAEPQHGIHPRKEMASPNLTQSLRARGWSR